MKHATISFLILALAACTPSADDAALPEPTLETIIDYDVTAGEQPVDVSYLSSGDLAVTLPFINEVRLVDAVTGATQQTFNVPAPSGVTEDNDGNLIVTTIPGVFDPNFNPETDAGLHGVSRLDLSSGDLTPLVSYPFTVLNPDGTPNPEGVLARDAVVAADGTIYVSDLAGGRIFFINPDGSSGLWSDSDLLLGNIERPGPEGRPPFLTGINGMRLKDGSLYAANTDYGRLVRFPIRADGAAGEPEIIVENDALLGFDEFEFDDSGDIYAILAFRYELVKVTPEGEVSVVFGPNEGIDNPAGLSRGRGEFAGDLFLTNLGFITNNAGGEAKPGLLTARNVLQ